MIPYHVLRARRLPLVLAVAAVIPALPVQAQKGPAVEEVVVTGSHIRRQSQFDTANPLQVVDGDEFASQGATSIADIVKNLTVNAGAEFQVDSLDQNLTSGTSNINLRNLGLNSTLVLVNGRRQTGSALVASDGSSFVDTNSLMPTIMIERMEVVKDGAAATYGSDAVAGVVNFISRKRFEGGELRYKYQDITDSDGDEQEVSGIWGKAFGDTHWVIAGSYYNSDPLQTPERKWSLASTYGFPAWAAVSSSGQPGNFQRVGTSIKFPDPQCGQAEGGVLQGTSCKFDYSPYFDLSPDEERYQIFTSLTHDFSETLEGYLELGYAHTEVETIASPSFPFAMDQPLVPTSHPDNPFGEDVQFFGRVLGANAGPSMTEFEYDTYRLAGALDGQFSNHWFWNASVAYSWQEARYDRPDTLRTRTVNALRGLGGPDCDPNTGTPGVGSCQYFNPFASAYLGTGNPNDPALLNHLIGSTDLDAKSSLFSAEFVASGDLMELPAGALAAAFGVHYRDEFAEHDWGALYNAGEFLTLGQAPDFDERRDVYAVFTEFDIPLASGLNAQISARYEDYGDGLNSVDPKLALLWQPSESLSFRTSWGTAFRAPSIFQTSAVQASQPFIINDPVSGAGFFFVNNRTAGNPDLDPEEAEIFNLGATWEPIDRFQASLDFWWYDYEDLIVKELVEDVLAAEAAGDPDATARVVRPDPNRPPSQVNTNFINASSVKTYGYDLDLSYGFDNALGDFTITSTWTYVDHYWLKTTQDRDRVEGAGSANQTNFARSMPRLRGNTSLRWQKGIHSAAVYWRYVSSYDNDRPFFQGRIGRQQTYDAQYNLTLDGVMGDGTATISLGVINLLDEEPPKAKMLLGYDSKVHDPRGRMWYVDLKYAF